MAARRSGSRLEIEIERCRSEGQWNKIPELVRQLSAKSVSNDDLGELLLGQCKLQTYLKELPINQGVGPRGTTTPALEGIRKHFTAVLDKGTLKADYLQEASLLMAKTCYVEGEYEEALAHYSRGNVDELQLEGAPLYRLSMIAEAYATKGLCLEKVPTVSPILSESSQKSTVPERYQEILACFEKSGDIALLYLQETEKAMSSAGMQNHQTPKPGTVTQDQELGYFLEMDLQKTHIIHFTNGDLMHRMGRFRELLRAVETRTTRNLCMAMARQLAEILLRGTCEQNYWPPWGGAVGDGSSPDPPTVSPLDDPSQQDLPVTHPLDDPTQQGHAHSEDYTLSRRPQLRSGENPFCPQETREEELLLLLISESIANHVPEHNHRIISLQSASLVYDLLTIALGRRGYEILSECLERAMKFAFDEFHLWYQWALSLMATGKSARAVKVLKECIRLKPEDPAIPLLAVKLCIGPLHWLDEGERFAKMVLDMGDKAAESRAKGYLAIGLVYSLKATDASLRGTQDDYQRKALAALQRAQGLSPADHLAAFYLALQLAVSRQIPEALGYVRQALQLQGDHVHSLHLLALLLSAQKHYHDAFDVIEMALSKYPKNFNLLYTKAKLETLCREPREALLTCKHMLQIWKSFYNLTNPTDSIRGVSLMDRAISDKQQLGSVAQLPDSGNSATTGAAVHATTSTADGRVEQTLSEVASSLRSSGAAKHGPPLNPWMTLAQIWLHTAEVFVGMSKHGDAAACTREAANLFPCSHEVLHMRGRGAELRGNTDEAKRWYEEALAVDPTHVETMQRLGVVLQRLRRHGLSEKVLREAVQVDCMAHDAWNSLGEVLQTQGNASAATDCFLIALELEASSPVLPFTIIPRAL